MNVAPTSGGEIDHHRGMEHERAAVIFHALIRFDQYPSARITIETDEDATVEWTDPERGTLFEDVQCKKIEAPRAPASLGMGDWRPGKLSRNLFGDYLAKVRRGDSALGRLAENSNRFFTLIAYAEPSRSVERYVPPGVLAGGFTRSPATEEYFPLDYAFDDDPYENSDLGTPSQRQRIRAIFLGRPQLHGFAEILLHKLFGVRTSKTPDAFRAVSALFYEGIKRSPDERIYGLRDLQRVLRPYVAGAGKWTDVAELIDAEAALALPEDSPLVRWSDFADGRFIETELIRDGAKALREDGFLVVSGYHGCGKTVLCKYLAHRFLCDNPGAKCFYLQAEPGDRLADELDVFQSSLFEPGLFIIDDEHFAEEQVATIARAYCDARPTTSPVAKLVIATTETPRSSARIDRGSTPLNDARSIKVDLLQADELHRYLARYRDYRGLVGGDDSNLVALAGGDKDRANMGVALVLAHAADADLLRAARGLALESPGVRDAIGEWLASLLHLPKDDFEAIVGPVLTACSFGLPVRPAFNAGVERLASAGFLAAVLDEPGPLYRIRPEYSSLAWIVSRQHLGAHKRIFVGYLYAHNARAPHLAQALASDQVGRGTLLFLLQNHLDGFVPADRSGGPDFNALASTLNAARRAGASTGSAFLRRCFDEARGGYAPGSLRLAVLDALRKDVRPATAFLDAAYRADRVFGRRLGAMLIADGGDLYELNLAVRACPNNLEDLFRFLRAAKNCDIRFGTSVCEQFARDPAFEAKWQELLAADNPALIARALSALSFVNRCIFAQSRAAYLTETMVAQWAIRVADIAAFVEFLPAVRRLSPRLSSRALRLLLDRHRSHITSLVRNAPGIIDASAVITSIARVDRRVGIDLARECFRDLSKHVARETSHIRLGEGLGQLQRNTTRAISRDLAGDIDVARIVDDIDREKRRFELVGRFLAQLADVRPDVAEDLAGRVDYMGIYSRISGRALLDVAQLTRGLLLSLAPDESTSLLVNVRGSPALFRLFHDSLFNEPALHQIAGALSALASAGLSAPEIWKLFGTDRDGFRTLIDRRIQGTHSDLEIANLMFALAQLDPDYAAETVQGIASELAAEGSPGADQKGPARAVGGARRFRGPRGGRPFLDLAGTGALLHVASVIDDRSAALLLEARADALDGVASDSNLGRQTVLLMGMHSASRTESLRLLDTAYTESHLERLVDITQNPRELIQFLYGVQTVSLAACRKIAASMIDSDGGGLRDYLEAEVDLTELSRWVLSLSAIGRSSLLDAGAIAAECAEYDTRLSASLDAAQAMIAAGSAGSAAFFGSKILEQIDQARGVRKLSHCIQLWLKADYVARELRRPRIMSELAAALLPHALQLVAAEDDHVSSAFAVRLWLDCEHSSPAQRAQLLDYKNFLTRWATLANPATVKHALAAALLQPPRSDLDRVFARTRVANWAPWVFGLLRIVADSCGDDASPPIGDAVPIDPDQNNLKFGLACYARARAEGALPADTRSQLAARRADESSSAIRALLAVEVDGKALRGRPYYLWSYLRRTVLALSYLDWEAEVHRASIAEHFRKRASIDPNPLLSAAAE